MIKIIKIAKKITDALIVPVMEKQDEYMKDHILTPNPNDWRDDRSWRQIKWKEKNFQIHSLEMNSMKKLNKTYLRQAELLKKNGSLIEPEENKELVYMLRNSFEKEFEKNQIKKNIIKNMMRQNSSMKDYKILHKKMNLQRGGR